MAIPSFTAGQPTDGEKLGVSKVPIRNNLDGLAQTIAVDHVALNNSGQGKHKFVRMPNQASIPADLIALEGTLYTKLVAGVTQLFYSPDASENEYQLTRTIAASFTSFGQSVPYGTPPAGFTQSGGWTYLPGGMLAQYGFYGKAGATGLSGQVQFPVAFTTGPYSVQITLYRDSGNQTVTLSSADPVSTTTFNFLTSTAGSDGISWFALGV